MLEHQAERDVGPGQLGIELQRPPGGSGRLLGDRFGRDTLKIRGEREGQAQTGIGPGIEAVQQNGFPEEINAFLDTMAPATELSFPRKYRL